MILSFINIRKVPREMLKTSGFALGFQHLPRDLANVNEWKIMFDPYINNHFRTYLVGPWFAKHQMSEDDFSQKTRRNMYLQGTVMH